MKEVGATLHPGNRHEIYNYINFKTLRLSMDNIGSKVSSVAWSQMRRRVINEVYKQLKL